MAGASNNHLVLVKAMFSVGTEDEYYGESTMSTEPSDYDLHVARLAEERELKRQVKAFGKESMQNDPTLQFGDGGGGLATEDVQRSYIMRTPVLLGRPPARHAACATNTQGATDVAYESNAGDSLLHPALDNDIGAGAALAC